MPIHDGGLGVRYCRVVVLPAFVYAPVLARPLVNLLTSTLAELGVLPSGFDDAYELPYDSAIESLVRNFPVTAA